MDIFSKMTEKLRKCYNNALILYAFILVKYDLFTVNIVLKDTFTTDSKATFLCPVKLHIRSKYWEIQTRKISYSNLFSAVRGYKILPQLYILQVITRKKSVIKLFKFHSLTSSMISTWFCGSYFRHTTLQKK